MQLGSDPEVVGFWCACPEYVGFLSTLVYMCFHCDGAGILGGDFFALGQFGLAAPIKCLEKVALVLWCILLDQCVPCGVVVGRVALIWRWTLSRDLVNRAAVADRQVRSHGGNRTMGGGSR